MNPDEYIGPGFIAKSPIELAALREWATRNHQARIRWSGGIVTTPQTSRAYEMAFAKGNTYEVLEDFVIGPGFVADTDQKKKALRAWCETRLTAPVWTADGCVWLAGFLLWQNNSVYTLLPDWFTLPDGWIARTAEERIRLKDWCERNPGRKVRTEDGSFERSTNQFDPSYGANARCNWIIVPEFIIDEKFVADTKEKFEALKKWSEENPFVPIQTSIEGSSWSEGRCGIWAERWRFRPYFEKIYRYSRPGLPDIYSTVDYSGPKMTSKTCIN